MRQGLFAIVISAVACGLAGCGGGTTEPRKDGNVPVKGDVTTTTGAEVGTRYEASPKDTVKIRVGGGPPYEVTEENTQNSKATRENFNKIKVGMTEAEVDAILGPASSTMETLEGVMKLWPNIGIIFEDGKVKSPSMNRSGP